MPITRIVSRSETIRSQRFFLKKAVTEITPERGVSVNGDQGSRASVTLLQKVSDRDASGIGSNPLPAGRFRRPSR
jgi:hypothetical protein